MLASCSWNLHVLCIYHLKSINLPVIELCCWSCSARYKAGQQAPAIKEQISTRKCISLNSGTTHGKKLRELRTYIVPSSKNPVKMQILVGPDEGFDPFGGAAIQRLSWQTQKALQTIPSEISVSPKMEKSFSHSDMHCPGYARIGGTWQTLTWASEPILLRLRSSRSRRASDRKKKDISRSVLKM